MIKIYEPKINSCKNILRTLAEPIFNYAFLNFENKLNFMDKHVNYIDKLRLKRKHFLTLDNYTIFIKNILKELDDYLIDNCSN